MILGNRSSFFLSPSRSLAIFLRCSMVCCDEFLKHRQRQWCMQRLEVVGVSAIPELKSWLSDLSNLMKLDAYNSNKPPILEWFIPPIFQVKLGIVFYFWFTNSTQKLEILKPVSSTVTCWKMSDLYMMLLDVARSNLHRVRELPLLRLMNFHDLRLKCRQLSSRGVDITKRN